MKVLLVKSDSGACYEYRIAPYKHINSEIEFAITGEMKEPDIYDSEIKAVLIQRPVHEQLPEFICDLKKNGKKVVIEIDDDLLNVPAANPAFNYYRNNTKTYLECLKLSDYIHTSTPEIAAGFPGKSIVFHNAIELSKYTYKKTERTNSIMWQGSPTHKESLDLIKEPIRELLNKGVKVILQSNLDWLKSMFRPHPNLSLRGWVDVSESYKIPLSADINLTPLPQGKFNSAKSELKVLESAAWGIPSISSDISPYRRFHNVSGGANILIKKERTKEWVNAVMSLLSDDKLYSEKSRLSKEAVEKFYSLEKINEQRKIWWEKILK